MIKNAIRSDKIEGEATKRSALRRKDGEVNNTSTFNTKAITVGQPKTAAVEQQSSQRQESGTRQNSERMQFTPIPVMYRELYQSLYDAHAISPFHLKPLQPPYPKWYDANARCEYHAGIPGHSIENCTGFKKAVERLINMGVVKFDNTPNTENPLPNHSDQGVNAISKVSERRMKENIAEVRMPMKVIWEEMMKRGMLISKNERGEIRNYGEFHEVQDCKKFKALVQGFMDNKELQIFECSSCEKQVCMLENEQKGTSRPRIIISLLGNNEVGAQTVPKVIIHKPTPFPYKDSKRVPWSYDCNVTVPEEKNIASTSKDVQVEGSHTRSGKRYDTVYVIEEPTKSKNVSSEKEKEAEVPVKESVKEEEAKEFLKFLKHSENSVVKQLRRVLNETYVTHDISVNKLDRLVNNISADNFIYFNDDEIPLGGRGSTKALHITTRCKGYTLPSMLINNGSALNVLPLSTLNRLPIDGSHMMTCQNLVRAFDGTERKVIGRIDIPLEIGPKGSEPSVPKITRATRMALQMMVGKGALPRKGLGKYLQGGTQIPELKEKRDCFGLGFKPDYKQRRKEVEKPQEGRRARLNGREVQWEPMTFPPLSQIFISGRLLIEESHQINAIHDKGSEQENLGGFALMNREAL
ncbi:uncharacterized protein [Gossypium hirsutum]|uniref:G-patch domain-containing protein n=1 Tax=Gossypium hirsutum TaxID=3635 RepID=A0A1U8PVK5_GOSHI|nr:uncharacterized protein LOC107963108 [Gossypium hirsutum]